MNAKFRTEIRNGLAAVWREGALLIWLIMMNGVGALGAGLPANLEPGDVVPETKSMTSEDLKAATGIGDAGSSGWRMVLRGATAELYLFQARWADVSEFGMSRCVMHKLYVGPYDEYPFCYAGEYCCNCFGGYQDLNYEPWLQGAQHIIETWATLAGVLFQSDENFPLHLQFSAQGLAYVSGRGTARYRTGETILLGQDITIATWRKLAAGTGLAADGGIIALGYLKDTNGFDILAAALNDTNTSRRIKAVEALGRIGTPASVTFLAKAAADTNETVAEVVAESLGKAGQNSPAATAALVSFIGRASNVNSPREADVALWSLKQLAGVDKALSENTDLQMLEADPQTIAQLLEMAKDKSVANRRGLALRACALLASSGVNPLLSQSLSDRSSSESSELLALCALRHVEGADMDKLAAMADDSKMDKFTRRIAIWMAGRAGKEKAVPRLLPYLKDATDPEVRRGALLGSGQSGSSAAAEPLKAFCDAQTNDEARDSAAEALSMLGQKATGQLEALPNQLLHEFVTTHSKA